MKKIFLITLFISPMSIQADNLRNAIKQTNLAQVKEILNKETLSIEEKKSYQELSQEIKKLRLEAHIAGEKKFGPLHSPTSEIFTCTKIGWALMAALVGTLTYDSLDYFQDQYFKEHVLKDYLQIALPLGLLTINAFKNLFEARELGNQYSDSLEIENLLK